MKTKKYNRDTARMPLRPQWDIDLQRRRIATLINLNTTVKDAQRKLNEAIDQAVNGDIQGNIKANKIVRLIDDARALALRILTRYYD